MLGQGEEVNLVKEWLKFIYKIPNHNITLKAIDDSLNNL
jgi:hypothetical protein